MKAKLFKYLNSNKDYPLIAGLAAGLYPLGRYYNSNFTFIDSWSHFLFFMLVFIVLPVVGFYVLSRLFKRSTKLKPYRIYLIPILNFSVFAMLLIISIYGFEKKIMTVVLLMVVGLGFLLHKHVKKVIVVQLIMAAMVVALFIPTLYSYSKHKQDWMKQPDDIESVVFKKHQNVYLIQPDGYANFTELKNSNYNFDNSTFEGFLEQNNFKLYPEFRSNYYSTLSSNTSLFSMKHHYYSSFKASSNEVYKARQLILGKNPVLSIFKANNYKTHFIAETNYLLANKPELNYDYSNISVEDVPYFSHGYGDNRNVIEDLKKAINLDAGASNKFFFIQKILPGHVSTRKNQSKGKEQERNIYIERLGWANTWLEEVITTININDPMALIIILADHGGYVGYDYSKASETKQSDRDLTYTMFTAALAIKWPEDVSGFDANLKTNVNVFRVLFSYLSDDKNYLNALEEDKSFGPIREGAPFGVYELINERGAIVFEKFSN